MPKDLPVCGCGSAPQLVFACSGAADVGEISDRVARNLHRLGAGKMACLAGIGGRVSGIVKSTETAATVLAIDGCPLDCAKRTLEGVGLVDFRHVRITDQGVEKGKALITADLLEKLTTYCVDVLAQK